MDEPIVADSDLEIEKKPDSIDFESIRKDQEPSISFFSVLCQNEPHHNDRLDFNNE